MIGSADVHKAMTASWDAHGLEHEFKKLWTTTQRTAFPGRALQEGEATPQQPFPYCIFGQDAGTTTDRMSGHTATERHEIRDIPWQFQVYAKQLAGDPRTAKEIAANLIDLITQKYGGHPTIRPKTLTLDNGGVLLTQYQTDFPVRVGDEEYRWVLSYIIRIDVPVAA